MRRTAKNTLPAHLLIGLTGGIGSGKSTVADLFEKLGARIIDTDQISRTLTQSGGKAVAQIRDTFGAGYIDRTGALDRAKMRELVFTNPAQKQHLEAILHPLILEHANRAAHATTSAPYTLVVVPLLFEAPGYQDWLHRTLVVDCEEEIQIERTMQRSGIDRMTVIAIISQQLARAQRLALANDIIRNESDLHALSDQVDQLHDLYLKMASSGD